MKKILTLALLAVSTLSFADIPPPPQENNADSLSVSGEDAKDLWDVLDVKVQAEDMLRTRASGVKVFYSSTGRTQVVCHHTVVHMGGEQPPRSETYECTVQKSNNGKRLKKYVVQRRVG